MLNKMERQVLRLIESVKKPKSCLSQFSTVYETERKEPKEDGPLDNQDEKKEKGRKLAERVKEEITK